MPNVDDEPPTASLLYEHFRRKPDPGLKSEPSCSTRVTPSAEATSAALGHVVTGSPAVPVLAFAPALDSWATPELDASASRVPSGVSPSPDCGVALVVVDAGLASVADDGSGVSTEEPSTLDAGKGSPGLLTPGGAVLGALGIGLAAVVALPAIKLGDEPLHAAVPIARAIAPMTSASRLRSASDR